MSTIDYTKALEWLAHENDNIDLDKRATIMRMVSELFQIPRMTVALHLTNMIAAVNQKTINPIDPPPMGLDNDGNATIPLLVLNEAEKEMLNQALKLAFYHPKETNKILVVKELRMRCNTSLRDALNTVNYYLRLPLIQTRYE